MKHAGGRDLVVRCSRIPWRCVGVGLLVLAVLAVGVVGWMVCSGVSISLRAEVNLHATLDAIKLVEQFVCDNGRWPRSWEELESLRFPSSKPSPLNIGGRRLEDWPAESNLLQERVAIDFQADPKVIIRQSSEHFDAIKPIGPCYPYCDYPDIPSLQKTLREAIEAYSKSHAPMGSR